MRVRVRVRDSVPTHPRHILVTIATSRTSDAAILVGVSAHAQAHEHAQAHAHAHAEANRKCWIEGNVTDEVMKFD